MEATTKIITNNGHVCAVIYPYEKGFICAHRSSSMGFSTEKGAEQWLMTCDGSPFTPENNCYKMMPENVKKEISRQLQTINT